LSLETLQDAARSAAGSAVRQYNVSCQTCRTSRTFVTLQGANSFFDEHEGHVVIEGALYSRPETTGKPGGISEVSKPQSDEPPKVVAESEKAISQEVKPQVEAGADAAVQVETQAALPQAVRPAELDSREPAEAVLPLLSERDLEESLLLARSSYIGESAEKRIEALRVSRALKEFKWNVEPPYVIGIMVDDNLSVETNIGVISSSLTARVEKLGYKFVAINAPQGSPVAWFKKGTQDELDADSYAGDTERMMHIRQGKRTYDKNKAVWEESFLSLLMTVKDMDGQKLQHVTDIIKSERPEPDIHQ
jgi:hypothetical protein